MMNKRLSTTLITLITLLIVGLSSCNEIKDENTCTLYIAPSSVRGVNGVGIFTVKPFRRGSIISPPDSPSIPVCNPWSLASGIINDYWWGEGKGTSDEMAFESSDYTMDFFVQFGSLPNYHTYLKNFIIEIDDVPYDDTFMKTTGNPGAGAFSYHGGRTIVADTNIEAGDELFLNYGLEYDTERDYEGHWFEYAPRSTDFEAGGRIMEKTWEHLNTIRESIHNETLADQVVEQTLAAIRETTSVTHNDRVASVLPKTVEQLDRVAKRSRGQRRRLPLALAKEVSCEHRAPEWLIENGRCVDNIRPGRSMLPFAGRGAIVQRFIARGDVVVPVPLIQIMDRDAMIKWSEIQNSNGDWDEVPAGTQLLLNYCFGHRDSSLLLLPITNAILINHCSNRTKECGPDGPNAEWRWDTEWDHDTKHWLNMTLEEIDEEEGRGLSFEIIATRDIQPGEEVFIDYGKEWERAFEQHVNDWDPLGNRPIESVKEWNDDMGPIKILSGDLRKHAEHVTITTGCLYWDMFDEDEEGYREYFADEDWSEDDALPEEPILWRYDESGRRVYQPYLFEDERLDSETMSASDDLWKTMSDDSILWHLSEDGSQFTAENSPRRVSFGGVYWPCSVVREDTNGSYIVQVFPKPKSRDRPPRWHEEDLPHFLTNYPRESIRYFPRPDRSDMHLVSTFRHHIDIPDEMFPSQWKDRLEDDGDYDDDGEL